MAKHDVFLNCRSIIHKGSGDKALGGPDICKTQVGNAVIPIPYPNKSESSDLKKGSKSVKINNQPAALKTSTFSASTGDQAGKLGGLISGTTKDETAFISYSFDMKIEGKNVVRHADMTTHNKKNALGIVMGSSTAPVIIQVEDTTEKCPFCKKEKHKFSESMGSNNGFGQILRKNIINKIEEHPWYTKPNSLQAHHLICSEAMDDDDWYRFCLDFGYDINHKNNGVILPYYMDLACQLHVPLHRGNHSKGKAEGISYPEKISQELEGIADEIRTGKFCDDPKGLVNKLNNLSKNILGKISKFRWIITVDGKDYKPDNNGCSGVSSLSNKPNKKCPDNRTHRLIRQSDKKVIPRNNQQLEIGR